MKIIVLMENTAVSENLTSEHGLSLLIRTGSRQILFDAGQTDAFLMNAASLGADLSKTELAVISHGHYDHTGGLTAFRGVAPDAPVYIRENAFRGFFHGEKAIGIPFPRETLKGMIPVRGDLRLNEQVSLFTGVPKTGPLPKGNEELTVSDNGVRIPDDFSHEQNMVIEENGRKVLFSGCAHSGILNILKVFRDKWSVYPDAVFGGFHMMKETDETFIRETARKLYETGTVFYTGHCTGAFAFEIMKKIMGSRLIALSAGKEFDL